MDPRSSPERVVACHLLDEIDLLLRDLRSARFGSAFPFPKQPEALPVPADDCFRLDDQQRLFPRAENIGHGTEEESVGGPQSGSRGRVSEYFELFSEEDDLQLKLLLDLKNRRQNERKELSIWASVRLVDTHFKAAKVVRIRYVGRGWNIEEGHLVYWIDFNMDSPFWPVVLAMENSCWQGDRPEGPLQGDSE